MINLKRIVKIALAKKDVSMVTLALLVGKERSALTQSLYDGNTNIQTVNQVAKALGYTLSEFIKLGEE